MHETEKGKKNRIYIVRTIAFMLIALLMVAGLNSVLDFDDDAYNQTILDDFYKEDNNTIDVIYFGTSATQRAWNTPRAFHEYGIASYSMATASQPLSVTKGLIREALKTQSPKLFIIDVRGVTKGVKSIQDAHIRRVTDNMKESLNRIKTINEAIEFAKKGDNGVDPDDLSYYIKLIKYHERWNPAERTKHGNVKYFRGFMFQEENSFKREKQKLIADTDEEVPIYDETENILIDLMDFCKDLNADVLFLISPYSASEADVKMINYAVRLIESRNGKCLNFLDRELLSKIGIDYNTSFYNKGHLNIYGSILYTDYLSSYIKKNYNISDRRNDDGHDSWEEQYQELNEMSKAVIGKCRH